MQKIQTEYNIALVLRELFFPRDNKIASMKLFSQALRIKINYGL
jgi:hypothetical protein